MKLGDKFRDKNGQEHECVYEDNDFYYSHGEEFGGRDYIHG